MLYNLLQNEALQNWLTDRGLYWVVTLLHQLEFRAFAAVVLSFVVVLIFGRRVVRWLIRQKVGDRPEFYREDLNELMAGKAATPTMGGVLICGSILLTMVLLADLTNRYVQIGLFVLLWLAILGGVDDWLKLTAARRSPGAREGLYVWEKLLFQIGIGALAGLFLYMHGDPSPAGQHITHVLTLPGQRTYVPGSGGALESNLIFLALPVFVLISTLLVAGTSNAVNLTDGMDGLATGTLIVAAFALMFLCYIAGDIAIAHSLLMPYIQNADEMMVITGAAAGACLGFLWFNCHPAQVFMGDTGSLPLGGMLAYIAVAIRQEALFIIIGGVFFMELASVVMQVGYFRLTGGRRIFRCAPIHYHFQLGGWSEQQVVTRFWVLAVVFAMIAIVLIKVR